MAGCSCKKSPLQKLEQRISVRGWDRLAPSETASIDAYINEKLGVYPSDNKERIELYKKAKVA